MNGSIEIKEMTQADWPAVAEIYKEGIETGLATFEKEIPSWEIWDRNHIDTCRLVWVQGDELLGWAALSAVSSRCVYGGVAEVSVYVATKARGKKVGEKLFLALISESERNGFWTLQSGIFSENVASINLHKKLGFRMVGYREKIGQLNGVWRNTTLMERRSKIVGA
ncbi:MAG: GNAT family N-acetyltransferase [Flavobacteriaceae bacterium]|nr:GNAT family N-acetyltransferase [Flavobacteriaceae bacterium]